MQSSIWAFTHQSSVLFWAKLRLPPATQERISGRIDEVEAFRCRDLGVHISSALAAVNAHCRRNPILLQ